MAWDQVAIKQENHMVLVDQGRGLNQGIVNSNFRGVHDRQNCWLVKDQIVYFIL